MSQRAIGRGRYPGEQRARTCVGLDRVVVLFPFFCPPYWVSPVRALISRQAKTHGSSRVLKTRSRLKKRFQPVSGDTAVAFGVSGLTFLDPGKERHSFLILWDRSGLLEGGQDHRKRDYHVSLSPEPRNAMLFVGGWGGKDGRGMKERLRKGMDGCTSQDVTMEL